MLNVKRYSYWINIFSFIQTHLRSNLIPIIPPYSPIHILVKRTTRAPVNPCQPTPCGPNTICTVNNVGNAICNCVPGMIPKPDTITGCGPECVRDPDCQYGEVCLNQRCVEKPDPCDPSPCGPGAVCMTNGIGNAICRYVESPGSNVSTTPIMAIQMSHWRRRTT